MPDKIVRGPVRFACFALALTLGRPTRETLVETAVLPAWGGGSFAGWGENVWAAVARWLRGQGGYARVAASWREVAAGSGGQLGDVPGGSDHRRPEGGCGRAGSG
jgi:hypothetical protein